MPEIYIAAAQRIAAPPELVYTILADYRRYHPRILPDAFSDLTVEQGGVGDGTVIRFTLRVLGQTRSTQAVVTEPEPGRVLVETYPNTGAVTRFIVDPVDAGGASDVAITTTWTTPGLRGHIERLLAPRAMRKLYAEELANLEREARTLAEATDTARPPPG